MEANTITIALSLKRETTCETPVVLLAGGKRSLLLNKTLSGSLLFLLFTVLVTLTSKQLKRSSTLLQYNAPDFSPTVLLTVVRILACK
jgi:hypothetical protein